MNFDPINAVKVCANIPVVREVIAYGLPVATAVVAYQICRNHLLGKHESLAKLYTDVLGCTFVATSTALTTCPGCMLGSLAIGFLWANATTSPVQRDVSDISSSVAKAAPKVCPATGDSGCKCKEG